MKVFLVTLLIILTAAPVFAHPHVFVDVDVSIETGQGRITAIEQSWLFDDMFSAMMIMDYDKNRNGRLDLDEVAAFKKGYFDQFSESSYFTFIRNGKNTVKFTRATDFMPNVINGRLSCGFRLEMSVAVPVSGSDILIYDPAYYNSVKVNSASVSGGDSKKVTAKIAVFDSLKYYFGQISPDAVMLRGKK
ncbi:DUF1007 family protein [Seleniivibrio sp.]|uniref:DUF1007 family protein n=1 Tax=Seleniivibrio sp. TaxID=2898801 RepID=UPI0025E506B1|nr:DUF1007 family protein [Seleniivibrio sp.]MCD8554601.1 DUF1007 family protein [Seleniivibrio sp.]